MRLLRILSNKDRPQVLESQARVDRAGIDVHYWQQWRLNNIASRDRECASRNLVRSEWRTRREHRVLCRKNGKFLDSDSERAERSARIGIEDPWRFLTPVHHTTRRGVGVGQRRCPAGVFSSGVPLGSLGVSVDKDVSQPPGYKSETESRNDGEHRAVPPPAPPRNPTTTTSQTHPMRFVRITRPTVQPYCNRTARTEISDKKRSPLPDRPIMVLSTRQTGETLLQETLKMIKQTEDAGGKRGVGTWVDLLGARRYSVFARRVRPFALPWLEPASQTSANGCVRDRGCGRGRGRHRCRCGLWGAPTWGVRVRLGRVGNASSWGARVWIAMGREAEMVVHLPESRVQRGGEMHVCAMDGGWGWGASLVSMGRTRGLTLGSGGSRWVRREAMERYSGERDGWCVPHMGGSHAKETGQGRGAQQAEPSLRDTGGGGGVTEKDCAPVTERGRHIGSSESSASGRRERRTTLQADALVKAGVMKRVVALLTSGTSAAGRQCVCTSGAKILDMCSVCLTEGAAREAADDERHSAKRGRIPFFGSGAKASFLGHHFLGFCVQFFFPFRRAAGAECARMYNTDSMRSEIGAARRMRWEWCSLRRASLPGAGVEEALFAAFPVASFFLWGGGIIHIGICCASGAARREGSLVKGDGHIAVMCMLRRRIYPLYVSSSYGANVPSLQRKIP
ncbi:hypothetical protein K438DRAFT_1780834 [Mycena galopus ATCC 62051]|nr:hypothetical protein K438DRAFT_1780834 [Mycena galopus ATCC 62051]